jgi:hypothetical protein
VGDADEMQCWKPKISRNKLGTKAAAKGKLLRQAICDTLLAVLDAQIRRGELV